MTVCVLTLVETEVVAYGDAGTDVGSEDGFWPYGQTVV